MKKLSLLCFLLIIILSACAKIEFIEGGERIVSKHATIAILPSDVYDANYSQYMAECLLDEDESDLLNAKLFKAVFNKNASKKYRLKIIGGRKVRSRMQEADMHLPDSTGYAQLDYDRLCEALDVDAVLFSEFIIRKPTSVGTSVAVGVITAALFGVGATTATNWIRANLYLYDRKTGNEIWSFEHELKGDFLTSKDRLQKNMMRKVAKKLPYY